MTINPSSKSGREKSGKEQPLVLVLGGGNALGSYLAGAYESFFRQSIEPRWIVGGSIGAVTGAIIAGNAPEDPHRLRYLALDPQQEAVSAQLGAAAASA
ncbi:patatin-like phospholipase family protein [Microvirga sp. 2MCAF35]|uniref:patatin-like phospholipase family protein n=1 Tax=Microvirga sp. 2MCAF35 TaxID=3232987 RepID=UPI003F97A6B6